MLDPFLPENPDDVARLKAIQREIHAIFIALVKESRGSRLKGADDVLFTGEYWAGETSVSLGLADAIGDLRSTLRARYGDKVLTPVIAPASGMLSGLLGRQIAGRGRAGRARRYRGPAGRADFGAGDPGDLGQIRVLEGAGPRHLVPEARIAARPGLRENMRIGGVTDVNDKDRPMPPLIAFAGRPGWARRGPLGLQDGRADQQGAGRGAAGPRRRGRPRERNSDAAPRPRHRRLSAGLDAVIPGRCEHRTRISRSRSQRTGSSARNDGIARPSP